MRYILIPVKSLPRAKQRLAGLLTRKERAGLARVMMEHLFAEVAKARGYDGVAVVTLCRSTMGIARQLGFEVIPEDRQVSESASIDYGSSVLRRRGVRAVLRLPIDLPLISADDIEMLMARLSAFRRDRGAIIVPSRDETGTNALGRTPPDLFPSHFGPQSLAWHLAEARDKKIPCDLVYLPRVACDLDDPEDLAFLLHSGRGGGTLDYLKQLRLEERLRRFARVPRTE